MAMPKIEIFYSLFFVVFQMFGLFGPFKVGEFSFWYSWTTRMNNEKKERNLKLFKIRLYFKVGS